MVTEEHLYISVLDSEPHQFDRAGAVTRCSSCFVLYIAGVQKRIAANPGNLFFTSRTTTYSTVENLVLILRADLTFRSVGDS
jgi:hypothetical protein